MIKIVKRGRLGNNLFQNIVASIFSKKFNLKVDGYINHAACKSLNCNFYAKGERVLEGELIVTDKNFISLLNEEHIDSGITINDFFQKHDFISKYEKEILSNFNFKSSFSNNNDLFIHVRLGDLTRCSPGIDYYSRAIELLSFNIGYVSSDEPNSVIVQTLVKKYNLNLCSLDPVTTILYAKDFNNVILSKSTFSWWIGFLSNASNIIYPSYSDPAPEFLGGTPKEEIFKVNERWRPLLIKV